MFELPDAKRVRRDELYDSVSDDGGSSDDAAGDAAIRAKLDAQLSGLFALDFPEPTSRREAEKASPGHEPEDADRADEQEEEFEFRLFSTAKAETQKIVLEHDEDSALQNREGGLVVPERPASFYLATETTPEQRTSYSLAAVTAEEIFRLSKKRAWGLEVPWRVRKITVSSSRLRALSTDIYGSATLPVEEEVPAIKQKRPGKKRRILLRTKDKAKKQQQEAAEKLKMSKEEHLKEKKKRLNRGKKLKRRQKDKEKKLAAQGTGGNDLQDGYAGSQQEGSESEAESAST